MVEKDRRHNKIWLNFKQFGVKLLRSRLENFGIVRFHDRGPFLTEAGHFLEVRFRESLFIDFLGSVHVHVAQEDVRYGTFYGIFESFGKLAFARLFSSTF